jgi:hypothetical protein
LLLLLIASISANHARDHAIVGVVFDYERFAVRFVHVSAQKVFITKGFGAVLTKGSIR